MVPPKPSTEAGEGDTIVANGPDTTIAEVKGGAQ